MPEVVVRAETALQVSEIFKLANEAGVPVTPRGAGSGLSGAALDPNLILNPGKKFDIA